MPKENKVRSASLKRRQKETQRNLLTYGLIGLALLAVLVFSLTRPHAQPLSAARLASDPSYGPVSAKVTIVEYSDYGCPSCQAWHNSGTLQRLRDTYGDKIRFVWKDFPVITAASPKAAEAGQCAFDQGKFWEYHDLLYSKMPALGVSELKAYAGQVGLDQARFDACLDSSQDAAKVEASTSEGHQLGFNGAPYFVVNGQKLVGPPTFEVLQALIDPILASGS